MSSINPSDLFNAYTLNQALSVPVLNDIVSGEVVKEAFDDRHLYALAPAANLYAINLEGGSRANTGSTEYSNMMLDVTDNTVLGTVGVAGGDVVGWMVVNPTDLLPMEHKLTTGTTQPLDMSSQGIGAVLVRYSVTVKMLADNQRCRPIIGLMQFVPATATNLLINNTVGFAATVNVASLTQEFRLTGSYLITEANSLLVIGGVGSYGGVRLVIANYDASESGAVIDTFKDFKILNATLNTTPLHCGLL